VNVPAGWVIAARTWRNSLVVAAASSVTVVVHLPFGVIAVGAL
jgi:hypothetical protein